MSPPKNNTEPFKFAPSLSFQLAVIGFNPQSVYGGAAFTSTCSTEWSESPPANGLSECTTSLNLSNSSNFDNKNQTSKKRTELAVGSVMPQQVKQWCIKFTKNIPILPIGILDFFKQKLWPLLCSQQSIWHMTVVHNTFSNINKNKNKNTKPLRDGPN